MKIVILIFEERERGRMINYARCQNCTVTSPRSGRLGLVMKWARCHAKVCDTPGAWTKRGIKQATLLGVEITEL